MKFINAVLIIWGRVLFSAFEQSVGAGALDKQLSDDKNFVPFPMANK
ncbi:hypothetical protein HQN89_31075 [Paenibacillus frigoriresistens]|nr:hypothetical protein [Paenibacillus frigoriresistens]